ncbi:MAG: bifunctional folylpolyglutamate synthase/dihydrofolate synthase [Flavobacteriaceae bacterium]|jgi:dihydrofolate synthase / folylpolyglutamate synthase|nr:bifunctional folylpolyglutamate synthase/dihydrofolate synthase [Formosa sp.]MDG1373956.1 bifunctional folylpolyglutamate synthase/dihydrofolate synthase [Flavobacteriaceae bacterium]MDG2498439.1 bifunctional folylpolyglutamate synthase/dihydrofolate synthase [Flavobacteriaceae bacterium]
MNYSETTQWLFSQLPLYQNVGKSAYKADLSQTLKLAKQLSHPEHQFKSIHVGGTNGKGSTAHMLASVMQEAGYKVGLYTSPHLKDYRERIRINGEMISEDFVVDFVAHNKSFFESNALSFFEMSVGMAFAYFAQEQVDIAMVEVGLGGRLDSTNILNPEVSVITNIGLDHTQFLGTTLEAIAGEKAGIIKPKTPIVIGETQSETEVVFRTKATKEQAPIYFADQRIESILPTSLKGIYQIHNVRTVLQTIEILNSGAFTIPIKAVQQGLLKVTENTGLQGRWEVLGTAPKIICDTAHNREGLRLVFKQIKSQKFQRMHVVLGMVNDKDVQSLLELFPKQAQYYFCKPNVPRGLVASQLAQIFTQYGFEGSIYPSVKDALKAAKQSASHDDLIYVGGSTFVVAEII